LKIYPFLAIVAMATAISSYGQVGKHAEVFPGQSVESSLATLEQAAKSSGSSGSTLGDYTSHAIKLSVRTASGGAEIHAHYDDIFVVTQGKATLITGGSIVNAKDGNDGETKGNSVRDGESKTIVKGDVVHIPAGVPHQLLIAPGDVFSTIVVKIKE
jgi:mannose-6-phosphate isomerase-like protein (cupin superfamily)